MGSLPNGDTAEQTGLFDIPATEVREEKAAEETECAVVRMHESVFNLVSVRAKLEHIWDDNYYANLLMNFQPVRMCFFPFTTLLTS